MEMHKRRNGQRSVLRTMMLAVISLLLGFGIYHWNAEGVLGDALPMPFGYGFATVLSGSMEPALSAGDLVVIQKTDKLAPGDIVVYQSGKDLIIHRITALGEDMLQTKGDANPVPDPPIAVSSVKGKLVHRIPVLGNAVRVLKTPGAVVLLLAAAFVLMELSFCRSKRQDREEIRRIREEIRRLKDELRTKQDGDGGAPHETGTNK